MADGLKSAVIWAAAGVLVICWFPLLAMRRLTDRDPARYQTGRMFRRLGRAISRINPNWQIRITGRTDVNDRAPFVMVCNHLSQADIPLISNLPWDMKWVAKKQLFSVPFVGWMMKMAGDIPVERRSAGSGIATLGRAKHYLENRCSVILFPEGTRSPDGRLHSFKRGAFELAIRCRVPVLPLVIDGTQNCLPKRSWKFGKARNIRLKVLDPVRTSGMDAESGQVEELKERVRGRMREQLCEWRGREPEEVDSTF